MKQAKKSSKTTQATKSATKATRWDDLRYVMAVARTGSLLQAAAVLGVDHTTVGRRVAAAERSFGTTLFARSTTGLVLTADGEQLVEPIARVEEAIFAVERRASAERSDVVGTVKVTAPETLALALLAPPLALFAKEHPGLRIDLDPTGTVLNLHRREAEVAVRTVRSRDADLVARKAGTVVYGAYASRLFLKKQPVPDVETLRKRPLLVGDEDDLDTRWLLGLTGTRPSFTCVVGMGLLSACVAGAGVAVLPHYLGGAWPELVHLPLPDEPKETVWLTVHKDLRHTPRVRAVLDFLVETCTVPSFLGG